MGTSQNNTVLMDSTTWHVSRTYTLIEDVKRASPHTKSISSSHNNGSQNHCRFTVPPKANTQTNNRTIWISRCTQLESTAAMGTISRGMGIRFTRLALSTIDVVPLSRAAVKKLYGTNPQSTKTGNCLFGLGKTLVKTKVSTPIITSGLSSDHNSPRDMFR